MTRKRTWKYGWREPTFPKNKHFLPHDTRTYVCVSEGKKCSFFGKFGMLWNTHFEICPFILLPMVCHFFQCCLVSFINARTILSRLLPFLYHLKTDNQSVCDVFMVYGCRKGWGSKHFLWYCCRIRESIETKGRSIEHSFKRVSLYDFQNLWATLDLYQRLHLSNFLSLLLYLNCFIIYLLSSPNMFRYRSLQWWCLVIFFLSSKQCQLVVVVPLLLTLNTLACWVIPHIWLILLTSKNFKMFGFFFLLHLIYYSRKMSNWPIN